MNLTLGDLENESGSKILDTHMCVDNELPDHLRVCLVDQFGEDIEIHWELYSIWLATESDVVCGEAEEVGELMNLSSLKVNFCPFCGVKLPQN